MGNCLNNKDAIEPIENKPLLENSVDSTYDSLNDINSVESPSWSLSSSISSSPTPPLHIFMSQPSSHSSTPPPTPPPTPPTTPPPTPTKQRLISLPVQKKQFLNELLIQVPEIKANYRFSENSEKRVFSPSKHRFDKKKYEEHMAKENVCQLCETLFPSSEYLKSFNLCDSNSSPPTITSSDIKYCFNCIKFLSADK